MTSDWPGPIELSPTREHRFQKCTLTSQCRPKCLKACAQGGAKTRIGVHRGALWPHLSAQGIPKANCCLRNRENCPPIAPELSQHGPTGSKNSPKSTQQGATLTQHLTKFDNVQDKSTNSSKIRSPPGQSSALFSHWIVCPCCAISQAEYRNSPGGMHKECQQILSSPSRGPL